MFTLKIDLDSPFRVALPAASKYREILALGRQFVRRDQGLSAAEQFPKLTAIDTIVLEMGAARQRTIEAEAARKEASEALKRTEKTARQMIRMAQNMLEATFATQPEKAQAWGFIVRQTGPSAGRLLLPLSRDEMIDCLDRYITTEMSRPEAEQFTLPSFAQIVSIRDQLKQHLEERDQQLHLRKQNHAQVLAFSRQLRALLKEALTHLILYKCDGTVCRDLENWGFRVTAKSTMAERESVESFDMVEEEQEAVIPAQ